MLKEKHAAALRKLIHAKNDLFSFNNMYNYKTWVHPTLIKQMASLNALGNWAILKNYLKLTRKKSNILQQKYDV